MFEFDDEFDDDYIRELNAAYWAEESEMEDGTHPLQILERVRRELDKTGVTGDITFMNYNISGSRVIVSVSGSVYGIFDYEDNRFVSTPEERLNDILEANGFGLYNNERTENHIILRIEGEKNMNKNKNIKEIHIPKAENTRVDTNNKLVINWLDKIEKSKREGNTYCYVAASSGGVTKYAVQKFIDAGYDIYFNHFMNDGSWFVQVHWEDGCRGRIYSKEDDRCVSIDEMFTY